MDAFAKIYVKNEVMPFHNKNLMVINFVFKKYSTKMNHQFWNGNPLFE
jgi:hypothetical protein